MTEGGWGGDGVGKAGKEVGEGGGGGERLKVSIG